MTEANLKRANEISKLGSGHKHLLTALKNKEMKMELAMYDSNDRCPEQPYMIQDIRPILIQAIQSRIDDLDREFRNL